MCSSTYTCITTLLIRLEAYICQDSLQHHPQAPTHHIKEEKHPYKENTKLLTPNITQKAFFGDKYHKKAINLLIEE